MCAMKGEQYETNMLSDNICIEKINIPNEQSHYYNKDNKLFDMVFYSDELFICLKTIIISKRNV